MRIIIDQDISRDGVVESTQYYDLDTPATYAHPSGNGEPCTLADVITYYHQHPELHERAGLAVKSKLPHQDSELSRWDRVLDHIMSNECHPSLIHIREDINAAKPE